MKTGFPFLPVLLFLTCPVCADELTVGQQRAQQFHWSSVQRSGIVVPMYVYPADIHTNAEYNRLLELRRRWETVPIWVIVNPASGPGKAVDANYTKAIDRLIGSGCMVLGYVSTSYGTRMTKAAEDLQQWRRLYPAVQGIFFDEMIYEDTAAAASSMATLNRKTHAAGFWPTVANPGADTPGRYFQQQAADVILIHEGSDWPTEERLHGNYFGGYADYPPHTRGILLHSTANMDVDRLHSARKYVRWFYVTEQPFRPNDPTAANPWNHLSQHMETLCRELSRPSQP